MSFKIVNVASRGKVDSFWAQKVLDLCRGTLDPLNPKTKNYTQKGLDLENHLTFDLLLDERGEIVTFCGIYSGGRFPEGVYRVLNRTYVSPSYRAQSRLFEGITSKHILPAQLESFRSEIHLAFVSRESLQARHFLKRWALNHAPDRGWEVSNGLVHVAPKSTQKNAYQYIVSKNYKDIDWNPEILTPEEWKALPD